MALKYRSLDADGDYTFGINRYEKNREAVAQAIQTRMYLLLGEWWENTGDGLPLFQEILSAFMGDERKQAVDLIISERILGTKGVKRIVEYSSEFDNRHYAAQCSIDTVHGNLTFEISSNGRATEVKY